MPKSRWQVAGILPVVALSLSLSLSARAAALPGAPAGGAAPETRSFAAEGSGIKGRVLFEGQPAAAVRIHAYREPGGGFPGEGVAASAPTAADGGFRLELPPGRYYLVGKGVVSPPAAGPDRGELFGYYGGSPVTVSEGSFLEVNLQVVRRRPMVIREGEGSTARVEGTVLGPRGPVRGASVFSYPDARSDFRGPDLTGPLGSLLEGTDAEGRFSLELPPGTYHLTASRRGGEAVLGPLAPGDLFGYFDGNPLRLKAGQTAQVVVQLAEKLRQVGSRDATTPGVTGIRGKLRDPAGKPVSGVFAFATTDPNLIGTMPPHHSLPVGPDGDFFIELQRGGTYFVGARTGFGGPPQPGQWWGLYGGDAIRPVAVTPGAVADGIDITVAVVE